MAEDSDAKIELRTYVRFLRNIWSSCFKLSGTTNSPERLGKRIRSNVHRPFLLLSKSEKKYICTWKYHVGVILKRLSSAVSKKMRHTPGAAAELPGLG